MNNSNSSEDSTGSRACRYVVGIDLGTTNSAVCFVDTEDADWPIQVFGIPQHVAAGQTERRETLPSFHYQPAENELQSGALNLDWSDEQPGHTVGVFAREHGRSVPGRTIESAKSWLCHSGVDRESALLPWHGAADVEALSPVDVSACYLAHVRDAWNAEHADDLLEKQDVIVTIPASFDEVARELTVAAARKAGLPRIVLVEEPQAAFYSWVNAHRDDWQQHVEPGQKILVCDVGGGTSDFTLIQVRKAENDDRIQFHRVAVGDHLILGGDNLDLALAHYIEHKLAGDGKLDPKQWSVLVPTCRHVKETLLGQNGPAETTVTLPGKGSKLIGGSLQVNVNRDDIIELLVDGFLPSVSVHEQPDRHASGFQEFGLPFAADAAISKYLATFLLNHATDSQDDRDSADGSETTTQKLEAARPDIVLFNGGFFASPVLRERLLGLLESWFGKDRPAKVLENDRLDLAVARGAAYFGMVRRGVGIRIVAGLARTYYVGVDQQDGQRSALCLIAAGTEPSADPTPIDREFTARTSEPVEFPIHVSSIRLGDKPGSLAPIDNEQMKSLPPIRTVLHAKKKSNAGAVIQARLSARLTEIGTLEIWCQDVESARRWQLQFDVRSATETDRIAHTGSAEQSGIVDEELAACADAEIRGVFEAGSTINPDQLPKRIAKATSIKRNDWPPSLLRSMWASLVACERTRRSSPQHEARWLNLVGFSLRPGFGMAADDWRVMETRKLLRNVKLDGAPTLQAEWWILWRRIAGGLGRGQQLELVSPIVGLIRRWWKQNQSGQGKRQEYSSGNNESSEIWRTLGAMELLPIELRHELASLAFTLSQRPKMEALHHALLWALSRLAARVPVYGPLNSVLRAEIVEPWIRSLISDAMIDDPVAQLAIMQMSRKTGDRYRDISDELRELVLSRLAITTIRLEFVELIEHGGSLDSETADLVLGESLPAGLVLRNRG
jgi:molecular chaperone DnaK (HSP70)